MNKHIKKITLTGGFITSLLLSYACSEELFVDEQDRASLYPYSTHNGKGDAFRHAYFNTLNVISIGKYYTEKLTTAHENRPSNYAFAFKETNMDLFNNNVGRNYGDLILAGNSSSAKNLIKLALQNGELMYLTPLGNDNCPTCANDISKLTPTNQ